MGVFTGDIKVKHVDGRMWEILSPIEYIDDKYYFIIPKGFKTDFATIPYFLRWFVQPTGNHTYPAILHDYMWLHTSLKKSEVNKIFYNNLLQFGVKPWKAWLMWKATCAYGLYFDKFKN